jgi:hypothetical protein
MYIDRAWAEDTATHGRDLSAAQGQDQKDGRKPSEYRLPDWLQSDKSIHSLCFVPTPLTSRPVCPIYAEPIHRWVPNHPGHVLQHRLDESQRKATRQKESRQRRCAMAAKKA